LLLRLDHPASLDDVVAGGLFTVDILFRLSREHGQQRMPVIRCRDRNSINRGSSQNRRRVGFGEPVSGQ